MTTRKQKKERPKGELRRNSLRRLPHRQRTIPALLKLQAEAYGEKPLLQEGSSLRTYKEIPRAVGRMAAALNDLGVEQGDRVAVLSRNRPEVLELSLACAWMGAIFVPLNTALRGFQLTHQLRNSGSKMLAMESALLDRLDSVEDTLPELRRLVLLDGVSDAKFGEVAGVPLEVPESTVEPAPVKPADLCAILYTSGTTGPPKGVCCSHAQSFWWGIHASEHLGIGSEDVLYTCLPLFHTNALNAFMQALCTGATYVLGERFSASSFWEEARRADATITYLLGAMVHILWNKEPSPADRAHRVRVALAPPAPADLLEPFAERFGVLLVDAFGMTELNYVIGATPTEQRPGRMGREVEGFEVRVVNEDDEEVPDGESGELVVRHSEPDSVAAGYWRNAEATVEAWRNLWFHTGDRVVRGQDGYFTYVDRIKDSIRRRGENISSYEVEQPINSHPDVLESAVVAVPSELSEDEVKASVVLKPGAKLDPLEIIKWCEPRMAYFAVPRYVEFLSELPHTPNGKVQKHVLRKRGVEGAFDRESVGYKVRR